MDDKKLEALAKELAKDIKSEKDLSALSRRLVKLTVETALNAEIEDHLGYPKNNPVVCQKGTWNKIHENLVLNDCFSQFQFFRSGQILITGSYSS